MSNLFVIINDDMVLAEKAGLSISDLLIQRGYGIFDFFKTVNGHPVFLEDHLDRFYYSASQMRLPVEKTRQELKAIITELLQKNNLPHSGIRITLTGGYSNDGYSISKPNMIITQQPLTINQKLATKGIRLITYPYQRQMAHVKTLDYVMAIWLQPLISQQNADDVLYHQNGIITECPRANFFIINKENKIVTPANNILKGIIRKQILNQLCNDYMIEERDMTINDIFEAPEAFITSTTKNIMPVVEVDGHIIGNGMPGRLTCDLSKRIETLFGNHET